MAPEAVRRYTEERHPFASERAGAASAFNRELLGYAFGGVSLVAITELAALELGRPNGSARRSRPSV